MTYATKYYVPKRYVLGIAVPLHPVHRERRGGKIAGSVVLFGQHIYSPALPITITSRPGL